MYLLTFATLIIGLIGIYSQVLAVQTARIAASQTGFAAAMADWQAAAVAMGASLIHTNTGVTNTICSLTQAANGYSYCPPSPMIATQQVWGTVTTSALRPNLMYNYQTAKTQCVPLLGTCIGDGAGNCTSCTVQYDVTDYQFNSLLYNDGKLGVPGATGKDYVVTYVPPAAITKLNPAPGLLAMARGNLTGFTMADLTQQLQQAHIPGYSYGTVQSAKLSPNVKLIVGPNGSYNVPASIPDGSLAMIASPDGF